MPRALRTLIETPTLKITYARDSRIARKIRALAATYGVPEDAVELAYADDNVVIFAIRVNGSVKLVKRPAAWLWGRIAELTRVVR